MAEELDEDSASPTTDGATMSTAPAAISSTAYSEAGAGALSGGGGG